MIRYNSIKNIFILKDSETRQVIKKFKSAQRLFNYLGGKVYADNIECKYYGTFLKVLGNYSWSKEGDMEIISLNGEKNRYKLFLKKELRS